MKIKYNRVSTIQQSGNRLELDNDTYNLTLLDKVSGSIPFMELPKGKEVALFEAMAIRWGKLIKWDSKNMCVVNDENTNILVIQPYRCGC